MTPTITDLAADPSWRSRVRFVLVGTQHTGNTGSAARALKTMQFGDLVLVAPSRVPDETAYAMAAGADDILDNARIVPTLQEAVADCHLVIGTTARSRKIGLQEWSPPQAAAQTVHSLGGDMRIAFVFGRERTGLTNEELQLCNAGLMIPANPQYSSLNLASAVQIVAYELNRTAATDQSPMVEPTPTAPHSQWEGFFGQLERVLESIDFHKGREPKSALFKLRRAFLRSPMDEKEVRMLRGVLHDMQRALSLRDAEKNERESDPKEPL